MSKEMTLLEAAKIITDLRAQLAAFRWVSVSERLPEEDCQIWICYEKTRYTYGAYYQVRYKLWQIFDPCGGWSNVDAKSPPTHWMPMPLLPEKAEKCSCCGGSGVFSAGFGGSGVKPCEKCDPPLPKGGKT